MYRQKNMFLQRILLQVIQAIFRLGKKLSIKNSVTGPLPM